MSENLQVLAGLIAAMLFAVVIAYLAAETSFSLPIGWEEGGFLVLVGTLLFTGAAAVAAWQTVYAMRDTAKRELRAYVSIHPKLLINFGSVQAIRIEFQTTNHGQTPAFCVNHVFQIEVLPSLLPADFQFPAASLAVQNNSAVFPHSWIKTWFHARPLTAAEVASIEAGTHNLYVWGETTYFDAFGQRRTTRFNASLDLPTFTYSRSEIRAGRQDPGFNWEYRDQHNQAT